MRELGVAEEWDIYTTAHAKGWTAGRAYGKDDGKDKAWQGGKAHGSDRGEEDRLAVASRLIEHRHL